MPLINRFKFFLCGLAALTLTACEGDTDKSNKALYQHDALPPIELTYVPGADTVKVIISFPKVIADAEISISHSGSVISADHAIETTQHTHTYLSEMWLTHTAVTSSLNQSEDLVITQCDEVKCAKQTVNIAITAKSIDAIKANTSNRSTKNIKGKTKVLTQVHTWFQSPVISGEWGYHWHLGLTDPNRTASDGQHEIASRDYPLIGPYDSNDPDVIQYHTMLMRLSGIDAAALSWYGSHDILDFSAIDQSVLQYKTSLQEVGLEYVLTYDFWSTEQSSTRFGLTTAVEQDFSYLEQYYFSDQHYLRIDDQLLLQTIGSAEIDPMPFVQAFPATTHPVSYYHFGSTVDELTRVDFLPAIHVGESLFLYYARVFKQFATEDWPIRILGITPGIVPFNQFSPDEVSNFIDREDGASFAYGLDFSATRNLDAVQVISWNNFESGTNIEPTVEEQYRYLEMLQQYTGVNYTALELELCLRIYMLKRQSKHRSDYQELLDKALTLTNHDQFADAWALVFYIEGQLSVISTAD